MTSSRQDLERNKRTNTQETARNLEETPFVVPEGVAVLPSGKDENASLVRQQQSLQRLQKGFISFTESLNDVLLDVTALEVNTMLVDEIRGTKFLPEDAYQDIYFCLNRNRKIPRSLIGRLEEEINALRTMRGVTIEDRVPPSFKKYDDALIEEFDPHAEKYWQLRDRLRREYSQIFFNDIYDEDHPYSLEAELPFPYDVERQKNSEDLRFSKVLVDYVLQDSRFLRSLRKLIELKAAIAQDDKIYAQTVIQLDGDVITRYRKSLFEPSPLEGKDELVNKELIMNVHHQGVTAAEEQWRGLLRFCVQIVKELVFGSFGVRRNEIDSRK